MCVHAVHTVKCHPFLSPTLPDPHDDSANVLRARHARTMQTTWHPGGKVHQAEAEAVDADRPCPAQGAEHKGTGAPHFPTFSTLTKLEAYRICTSAMFYVCARLAYGRTVHGLFFLSRCHAAVRASADPPPLTECAAPLLDLPRPARGRHVINDPIVRVL